MLRLDRFVLHVLAFLVTLLAVLFAMISGLLITSTILIPDQLTKYIIEQTVQW